MEDSGHPAANPGEVTKLLERWRKGDSQAMEELMPLIYNELKHLAAYHLRLEGGQQSLNTTALVHEAYLRVAAGQDRNWKDRVHFFAVTSHVIRHILVDHARHRKAAKRDLRQQIALDEVLTMSVELDLDLIALDRSLQALDAIDHRKSQVVELRFFGGLSVEETAEALGVSCATVHRDWEFAKMWLYRNMNGEAQP
jgi:RNA polymerase sigma factor (TIGR02999 family)